MIRARRIGTWLALLAAIVFIGSAGVLAMRRRPLDDALRKAAHADDGRLVRLLLHQGADPQAPDDSHVSLVDWALGENKPDIAAALLEAGAKTDRRFMLLHAAANDDREIIRILLERGADPNVTDDQGRTPLHLAAAHGDDAAITMLLDRRANVDARDRDGKTPLMAAARYLSRSMADTDAEEVLLARGADVNARARDGSTPLTEALRAGKVSALKLFLQHGADLKATGKDGATPLHVAASLPGGDQLVSWLLKAGADRSARDARGRTPLDVARQSGGGAVIKRLTTP